jgi:uncharacterized membrane protein YphA (DoxX/SURF4 family)
MKVATQISRYLLGAVFLVFGLNGFLNFIKLPPFAPEAGDFLGALMKTGYLWTLLKLTEVVCGALLLSGLFVPLALVLLAPVVVNIVLFHLYLTPPSDAAPAYLVLGLHVFLLWSYRSCYKPLFTAKSAVTQEAPIDWRLEHSRS